MRTLVHVPALRAIAGLGLASASAAATAQDATVVLEAGPSTCAAAADLDGDGDLDLVVGQEGRPLTLLVNDGKGVFAAAGAFGTGESKVLALAAFDADGDGDMDVLVGGVDAMTRLWLNDGRLQFVDASGRMPESKLWATGIVTGDLDGDRDQDAVIANRAGDSLVFRNDGARLVAVNALPANLTGVTALALADLDGDKDLDLIFGQRPDAAGKGGRKRAARNDGHGKFTDMTDAWMPSATDHTMALALADFDGNGVLDLVCANRGAKPKEGARSAVHRRSDDGKFLASVVSRYAGTPAISQAVAVGDLDEDGDTDILLGNDGPEALYLNDGKGAFSAGSAVPRHDDDTRCVLLGDFDGDRDLDIVTVNYNAPVRRFVNAGSGQFGGSAAAPPAAGGNGEGKPAPAPAISPVAAGKYGSRAQARAAVAEAAPRKAINAALQFLADHQADDGGFPVATFAGGEFGDPPTASRHDVGVTGLALLCFLAEGSTQSSGFHAQHVEDGVAWLLRQQQGTGEMGPGDGQHGIYDHAIATLALAEAHALTSDPALRGPVEKALAWIERRRNADGGFRYEAGVSPSDASVTAWCALAQIAGSDGGLPAPAGAAARTLAFLRGLTDSVTGRTGYIDRGGLSSRTVGESEKKYPAEKSEAMTGAAVFVRLALGEDPGTAEDLRAGWTRLVAAPPRLEPEGYFDPYAWFHIAHAMCQLGDPEWATWRKALHDVLASKQRSTGKLTGSWDPDGPWATDGGRFASTALATLALQAEYRFAKLVDPKWRRKK